MNIKIIVDSSANLPQTMAPEVRSVPLKIIAGEREFVDDSQLDVHEMMEFLSQYKGKSGTACPSVAEWLDEFEGADWIFALTITGKLSGCYQSACIAAQAYQEQNPEAKILVLDTASTGPEILLLAEKLRELTAQELSFEEVSQRIRDYHSQLHLLFCLESMNNLGRNGRVPMALAKAVGILGLRIIGSALEGDLHPTHKTRGEKKALAQLWESAQEMGYAGGKFRICHTENLGAAQALAGMVREKYPESDVQILPNGGLCTFYSEQGGLIMAFECE